MGMYCSLRAVAPEEDGPVDAEGKLSVSLEKAWHGLHFLLTGSAWEGSMPLGFLLHGGETIGDEESGVRLFSPEETRSLDLALAEVSDDRLWERFDPDRMTAEGIYPVIWDEPEGDLREEYLGYFHAMKELIHRASAANRALLVSIG